MKDFRELKVWEKSHAATLAVYKATGSYPRDEIFGLRSQLRRAAASVPANIAEGCGRGTDADFSRFLVIALGSASELDYHLRLSKDLSLLDEAAHGALKAQVDEVKRMLWSLMNRLKAA